MAAQLIDKQDVDKVWAIFLSLQKRNGFLDVARLAMHRNFVPNTVPTIRYDASLIGSTDYAALLDIMGILAKIKFADFNFFVELVSEICRVLVNSRKPVPFKLKNGALVYLGDAIPLERRLLAFLPYCLSYVNPPDGSLYFARNMNLQEVVGRHVGWCRIVKTGERDLVVYGKTNEKADVTRFVRNRRSEPTFHVWFVLIAKTRENSSGDTPDDSRGEFVLISADFGKKPPPTPDRTSSIYKALGPERRRKCRVFWREHAIVLPKDTELALEFAGIPPQWEI